METYFAPAERSSESELQVEINTVNTSSIVQGLLHSISGLLAVLNEHRQLVALNDSFLKMLGVDNCKEALGLRPGEAVGCMHAHETEGGCGTSRYCSTCGAAIAIVSSIKNDLPAEKICAMTANRSGKQVDISLLVRSTPIKINGRRFLLLFLQDITRQQQWAELDRVFFHDVSNLLNGLMGSSELLAEQLKDLELAQMNHQMVVRLVKEVEIQRCLSESDSANYHPLWFELDTGQVLSELQSFFANHPAARNKKITFPKPLPAVPFKTDAALIMRVLCNMVTNALEATEEGGEVRVSLDKNGDALSFEVWNEKAIPEDVSRRIFQRHFSTKNEIGHGLGTYSMKLFGESFLNGKVHFSTSEKDGTIFSLTHPC